MNILAAWQRGYTGKNVVITILDDGIERNHPDLLQNYVSWGLGLDGLEMDKLRIDVQGMGGLEMDELRMGGLEMDGLGLALTVN